MQKIIESKSRESKNAKYLDWSRKEALNTLMRRTARDSVKASYAWMLLPLALLLPGCAAQPTVQCRQPEPTPLPALTQALPSEPYSLTSAARIRNWQALVTGTSQTSKP